MRSFLLGWFASCLLLHAGETQPTFYADVLPVLQNHCQACHRPGEIAPMPLLTYKQVRPYAAAIREVLITHKMPPWGAESSTLKFANDPSLSERERQTILDWVAAKAPEGNPADAPPPKQFVEGWKIGKPDLVFEMPTAFPIPASGTVAYTYVVIPLHFKEDRWVQAAEVRASAPGVVHHIIAYIRAPGSPWLADAKPGVPYTPDKPFDQLNQPKGWGSFLASYVPGGTPLQLASNQGKKIKAGSDLVFEIHYTPNGKATADQSKLGIRFNKVRPAERVVTIAAANGEFVIPPGNPDYPVDSEQDFYGDAKIVGFFPHMHLRGKSMRYELVSPDGTRTTLVDVPRYDFHWQQGYKPTQPILVHSGSKIEVLARYDNSPNNRYNPDPTKEVRWGDQSYEEMMIGFMEMAVPVGTEPWKVITDPKDVAQAGGK